MMDNDSSCLDFLGNDSDVVRNHDGTLRKAVNLNYILFITHVLCCALGFPANIQLIVKVICNPEINLMRPRHIFLLSISLSSIFILIELAVEMANYFSFHQSGGKHCINNDVNCLIYESISGLPYVLFLFNLLASLIDCCVVLTGPGHYRNVSYNNHSVVIKDWTLWKVIIWLSVLNLTLALSVKWIFVSGFVPVLCVIRKTHVMTIYWTSFFLFVSCLVVYMIDLCIVMLPSTRLKRRYSWTVQSTASSSFHHQQQHRFTSTADETLLQIKIIKSFLFSVAPVLLLFIPWLASSVVCYLDLPWFLAFKDDCETNSSSTWLISYFRELIALMHGVVYPLINLCRRNV